MIPTDHPQPWREFALLVLLALLWGGSYPLMKIALESFTPITLIAVRVTVAAALLSVLAASAGDAFPRAARTWGALLVQAFFNSIGAWTLLAWGQQFVPSGLAGVLNSTSPIFVVLFTLLLSRSAPHAPARIAGVLLGLGGVTLVLGLGVLSHIGDQLVPQLATLAGAGLYACAAMYGRRFAALPPAITAAGTMLWASVVLTPVALVVEQPWALDMTLRSAVAALALGTLSTASAMLIYFRLLRTIGPLGVASQSYLRSVVAVGVGIVLLDESLSLGAAVGVGAIVTSMVLMNRAPDPVRRAPATGRLQR